jgi:hypothetical protein
MCQRFIVTQISHDDLAHQPSFNFCCIGHLRILAETPSRPPNHTVSRNGRLHSSHRFEGRTPFASLHFNQHERRNPHVRHTALFVYLPKRHALRYFRSYRLWESITSPLLHASRIMSGLALSLDLSHTTSDLAWRLDRAGSFFIVSMYCNVRLIYADLDVSLSTKFPF